MADPTIGSRIDDGNPTSLPAMIRQIKRGPRRAVTEYDSGTITAVAAVPIPGGALLVQSVHVVTSGTAASVGHYLPGNSTSTPLLPPGGANVAVGICTVAADGSTVTLPNTVTRVIIRYIKKPAVALTTLAP